MEVREHKPLPSLEDLERLIPWKYLVHYLVTSLAMLTLLLITLKSNRELKHKLACEEFNNRITTKHLSERTGDLNCHLRDAHLTLLKLGRNHSVNDDFVWMKQQNQFPLVAHHCIKCHSNSWPEETNER